MRVLITGGAGFIGSHVVERYLKGGWEVTVLDDLSTGRRENLPDRVDLLVADIASPQLPRVLEGVDFDLLNHHAAQIDVRASVADPIHDARVNLIGFLNLLEVVHGRGGLPVVFASSGGVVYGETDVLHHAGGSPQASISQYGVAKLASEFYLHIMPSSKAALPSPPLRQRLRSASEPRRGGRGSVHLLREDPRRSAVTVFGTGEQTRDSSTSRTSPRRMAGQR